MVSSHIVKVFKGALCAIALLLTTGYFQTENKIPNNFVFLASIDPTIIENVRYSTHQNFMARPMPGYNTNKIICTKEAAEQLKKANDFFKTHGYKLVVYDGYRPQITVDAFKRWSENPKVTAPKLIITLLWIKLNFSSLDMLQEKNLAIPAAVLLI